MKRRVCEAASAKLLMDDLSFTMRATASSGLSGRTVSVRPPLFKMIVEASTADIEGRVPGRGGAASRRHRHVVPTSIRTGRGSIPRRTSGRSFPEGLDFMQVGKVEVPSRAYVSAFGSRVQTSRSRPACSPAVNATALNLALT